jgi:protein-disulfide isomerase
MRDAAYVTRMNTLRRIAILFTAALALSACSRSDEAFGKRVRAYLLEHPEVLQEVAQKLQQKQQAEQAKAAGDAVGKFRSQLESDSRDFVVNPSGRITVVEFFDYRCGYCKLAAPQVVELAKQHPDVRFVFKEFPIFGGVSDSAAKLALTPQVKAKGLQIYQAWMSEKALDEAAIDRTLAAAGVDPAEARKAAQDPAIERQLIEVRTLASALKIEGTPAFVIGDTLIPGADMQAVRAAITAAKIGKAKAG